jgi:hypothetical protein
MAIAFEGEDVRGQPVKKEAVMADDHRATGEFFQRLFQRAQRFDIEIVGRFIEQEDIATGCQHLGEMDAVALSAGKLADLLLLVGALEVVCADIGPRVHFVLAEIETLITARDLFPDILVRIEIVTALVNITELHRLADLDGAAIGLFLAGDQLEQG